MRMSIKALFVATLSFMWISASQAAVTIRVDLSSQSMDVTSSSGMHHNWAVSTARGGYATPRGTYHPQSLQRMHYSHKYHMSPMPYSIFFKGGYAIHGTYDLASLGMPASHGCVRLAPENAATLFEMVSREGAVIYVTGTAPSGARLARAEGVAQSRAVQPPKLPEQEPNIFSIIFGRQ